MDSSARVHSWRTNIGLILVWSTITACLTYARLSNENFGAQGDLPVHYHLLRTFYRITQEGDWLPHWAGLLDGGRGDAIFTFYPPLAYWLGTLFMFISGGSVLAALKFLTVVSLWFAQFSAYQFARYFFSQRLSAFVSVAYVLLPTYGLLALHRAFLPNALALAIVPFALLGAFQLFSKENCGRGFLFFSLSFSALILTHVITTYLCGWLLLLLLLCRPSWQNVLRLGVAVAAALALTAFFWLPQQLEMRWVQVALQLTQQGYSQYLLFAPLAQNTPFRLVWHGLNELASIMTSLQTILSLVLASAVWSASTALAPIVRARIARTPRAVLFRWCVATTLFGLLISLPGPLWRFIPGLAYVQFPWRWQPFTALSVALLFALVLTNTLTFVRLLFFRYFAVILSSGALLLFVASIIRAPEPEITAQQLESQLNQLVFTPLPFEQAREMPDSLKPLRLATTANQVYFRPTAADHLLYPATEHYGGLTILNGRGAITSSQLSNESRRFQINAEEPLQARLETYAYPHWQARLDGQELPLRAEPESGLILLDVPAGKHELSFEFAPRMLAHRLGRGVSLLAWLGFAAWLAWLGFRQRKE